MTMRFKYRIDNGSICTGQAVDLQADLAKQIDAHEALAFSIKVMGEVGGKGKYEPEVDDPIAVRAWK